MTDLTPTDPEDAGVEEKTPEQLTAIEASRTLADASRSTLCDAGFDDDQIDAWADTFIAEFGSGDVDTFVNWIRRQESRT